LARLDRGRAPWGLRHGWAALATLGGRPIGIATVQLSCSLELGLPADIGDLWVDPAHRGQGVACAVIEACCR
jgi:GNAT superfamily N-acetyltransferase